VSNALIPVELSQTQLHQIAGYARSHGVQQYSWEGLSEFTSRILRELNQHPSLAREITINVFNITPSQPVPPKEIPAITLGQGALWAFRIGLLVCGIWSVF
jgi:hypothetical protein